MRERINSIEELEVMGIDFESKEVQQTITLMQEYWNRDIEVYLKDVPVSGSYLSGLYFGLYEVYSEGGIFLGYLTGNE